MKLTSSILIFLTLAACGSNHQTDKSKNQNLTSIGIPPSETGKGGGQKDSTQENEEVVTTIPSTNDTVFIKRVLNKDMYHAIFIEKKKNTKWYKWLTNFDFDKSDGYKYGRESYEEKYPEAYKSKQKTFGLPNNWIPVHKYKNQYYTYAPSDWGNTGQRIINNQEFIQLYMDGPDPHPIESSKKITSKKYEFTLFGGDILRVYIIDPAVMLCVFEYDDGSDGKEYKLYIPAKNASKFDMIVNHCETQKQREFDFDEEDYEAMIGKIK